MVFVPARQVGSLEKLCQKFSERVFPEWGCHEIRIVLLLPMGVGTMKKTIDIGIRERD